LKFLTKKTNLNEDQFFCAESPDTFLKRVGSGHEIMALFGSSVSILTSLMWQNSENTMWYPLHRPYTKEAKEAKEEA